MFAPYYVTMQRCARVGSRRVSFEETNPPPTPQLFAGPAQGFASPPPNAPPSFQPVASPITPTEGLRHSASQASRTSDMSLSLNASARRNRRRQILSEVEAAKTGTQQQQQQNVAAALQPSAYPGGSSGTPGGIGPAPLAAPGAGAAGVPVGAPVGTSPAGGPLAAGALHSGHPPSVFAQSGWRRGPHTRQGWQGAAGERLF